MGPITLKTFNDQGCLAHVVGCTKTRAALLVDPKAGRTIAYRKALADFELELVAVLDTHTHADHLSGTASFVREGIPLYLAASTPSRRPHRKLGDGAVLEVGKLQFQAFAVPGHTPDSIALFGHGVVISGDTLFAGGLARADFRGSNAAELFESVRRKILALPDATVVLPGHGYQDVLFSTIGHEKRRNPALQHADGATYAATLELVDGAGNSPEVDAMLEQNVAADPKLPTQGGGAVAACCSMGSAAIAGPKVVERKCEELAPEREKWVARNCWFDVRDPWEWKEGHIPGVPNYPLSELGFHLDELRRSEPAVLSCKSGVRSMQAAKTLAYLGVLSDPISMAGGFGRWSELGLPSE